MNTQIIPGILTDSLPLLKEELLLSSAFSERVHIDVIDGVFADNLTVMPEDMTELDFTQVSVDMHLMTEEPIDHLGLLKSIGVDRVLAHVERMHRIDEFVTEAQSVGIRCGLALDLYTPLGALEEVHMEFIDAVLLMSVKAGFSQQSHEHILGKISGLRARGYEGDIVIDGGMRPETIPHVLQAGANQFVVTSWLWETKHAQERYDELVSLVERGV